MLKGKDIIFLYGEDWDTSLRTSKFRLMEYWARNNRVLYVEQPLHPFVVLKHPRYFLKRIVNSSKGLREVKKNLYVYSTFYPLPYHSLNRLTSNPVINRINQRSMLPRLKQVIKKLGFKNPILWFCLPQGVELLDGLQNKLSAFHVVDEWSAFGGIPDTFKDLEKKMLGKADLVIATSKVLYDDKKPYAKNIHLVRHAADIAHFEKVNNDDLEIPDDVRYLPRPVIGYYGALHKLDFPLIEYMLKRKPDWSFIFIGENRGPQGCSPRKLLRYRNFHFTGPKDYELLPNYLKAIDVAIMPFKINTLNKNMCPIKMYEFLAAGKPIVSVSLSEVELFEEFIYIAHNDIEFLNKLEDAVNNRSKQIGSKGLEWSRIHSWEKRIRTIEALIEEKSLAYDEVRV